MSWLKKLLLMRSSLRLPSGTGGGTLHGNALAAQLLAACLLLTLSSPSQRTGASGSSYEAALGGAVRIFSLDCGAAARVEGWQPRDRAPGACVAMLRLVVKTLEPGPSGLGYESVT